MSFIDPDHVAQILQDVLDGLVVALAAADRPAGRVARFPGPPTWDCAQLVAWPRTRIAINGTTTSSDILTCSFMHVLDINLLLNRCIVAVDDSTEDGIPNEETVDADGLGFATDMWILQRAITAGAKDGTFFGATCRSVRVNPIVPSPPQGSFSGMTTTIEVALL